MVRWLGREAAQWPHLIGALLILGIPFLNLTPDQTGTIMAAVVAASGGATALTVSGEKAAPLAAGLLKAVIALGLALHFSFSPSAQAGVMVFIEAGVAWYLRTQVVAAVAPLPAKTLPVAQYPATPTPVVVTPTPEPLPVAVVENTASVVETGEPVQIIHDQPTDASFLDAPDPLMRGPRHGESHLP
jgi:hypothetical protein